MKLLILFGEPNRKSLLETFLWQSGHFDEIQTLNTPIATSELRKYGFRGWLQIQQLQFKLAREAVRASASTDIIMATDYGVGRLCSFWTTLTCRKRKIFAMNCLQTRTVGVKRWIEKILDFFAWNNKDYFTTSNSVEDIKYLSIPEKAKKRVFMLPDIFCISEEKYYKNKEYDCMTGGYANRDFNLFFEVARLFPNKKFVCIVGSNFVKNVPIPDNCEVLQDIPSDQFYDILKKSKVVALPMLSEVASGLVVLKKAIQFRCLFLASRIPAIMNYIDNSRQNTVESFTMEIGNVQQFKEKLQYLWDLEQRPEERDLLLGEIIDYNQRYSPEHTAETVLSFFEKMEWI